MKNEGIRNWAHVTEIVLGIAVVLTLVFLVIEVRGISDRMRIAASDPALETINEHPNREVAESPAEASPYAGQEQRPIKSLSEREIRALRNGAGMGFAKLAELNSYPGPRHVLAVADQLELSETQVTETQALYDDMHRRAVALGADLLAAERALDGKFGEASIDEDSLNQALLDIGRIRAQLRYVHLEAHLRQRQLLSDAQVNRYDELRGYHQEGS